MTDDPLHADFLRQLLREQFGTPTKEWHPSSADREDAEALRLVVDNDSQDVHSESTGEQEAG